MRVLESLNLIFFLFFFFFSSRKLNGCFFFVVAVRYKRGSTFVLFSLTLSCLSLPVRYLNTILFLCPLYLYRLQSGPKGSPAFRCKCLLGCSVRGCTFTSRWLLSFSFLFFFFWCCRDQKYLHSKLGFDFCPGLFYTRLKSSCTTL